MPVLQKIFAKNASNCSEFKWRLVADCRCWSQSSIRDFLKKIQLSSAFSWVADFTVRRGWKQRGKGEGKPRGSATLILPLEFDGISDRWSRYYIMLNPFHFNCCSFWSRHTKDKWVNKVIITIKDLPRCFWADDAESTSAAAFVTLPQGFLWDAS